jgi:hypothetical protein
MRKNKVGKYVFINELNNRFFSSPKQGFSLYPLGDIICANQNIILLTRIGPTKSKAHFSKGFIITWACKGISLADVGLPIL